MKRNSAKAGIQQKTAPVLGSAAEAVLGLFDIVDPFDHICDGFGRQ
jgi:hypothetical protein